MNKCNIGWIDALRNPEKMAEIASVPHRIAGLESVVVPFDAAIFVEAVGMIPDLMEKQAEKGKYLWQKQ